VLESIKTMLHKFKNDIWKETGLGDAHRYRVCCVAAILTAAVITKHLDLLHFDIERIRDYLLTQLTTDENKGRISDADPAATAQFRLRDFLAEYVGETLTVPDKFRPGRQMHPIGNIPRGRISVRYEEATKRLYISDTVWRDWCSKKQISSRDTVKQLHASQVVLDKNKRLSLTAGTTIIGAAGPTIEINAEHPCLSQTLSVVRDYSEDETQRHH
jgi:hypothetical protein